MNKLPVGWENKKLGEVFNFKSKSKRKAADGTDNGKYKFFTSSDIQDKFIDEFDFEGKHLIFATGGRAAIHFCDEKFSTSADCFVVSVEDIITEYVYYYLRSKIHLLEKGFRGAGLKHLSRKYLEDMDILYPTDKETQKKIVSILKKAENAKEWRKEADELTRDYLKSVFVDIFGDPIKNPKKWTLKELKEISSISRGKFTPRPRNDPKYYNGKYPFIQTGDIAKSNHRLYQYKQTLNELGIKVSKKFKKQTVVIAIVGATIGETAILKIDTYAPDSIIGIIPDLNYINSEYLELVLRFWKPIFKAKAPDSARANINNETLKPVKIPLPPIELQNKFAEIDKQVEQMKEQQKQSKEQLDNLYNALMQKAFKGELTC